MARTSALALASMLALVFSAQKSQAQSFTLGGIGASSTHLDTLPDEAGRQDISAHQRVKVANLPNDFFGPKTPVDATDAEVAEAYALANMLVLAGLAAMLGIGMAITGISIMRGKPKRGPAHLMVNA